MIHKTIIYVPGKNPKPMPEQHKAVLWRTLQEGIRRAEPDIVTQFGSEQTRFELTAWNYLYYKRYKDLTRDLPWIDRLINTHGPNEQDVNEANSWHVKIDRLFYSVGDLLPVFIHFMPQPIRQSLQELDRYFYNVENIAEQIRAILKQLIREALDRGDRILLIGHSMGSIIAFDTLWELSHVDRLPDKVSFLSIGSPLGLRYMQKRLLGNMKPVEERYPSNIDRWFNLAAEGDLVAVDKEVGDDYRDMIKLGYVNSIEDHCEGIYNHFRNEEGLNCHRSYGYLVNPAVGTLIADWWRSTSE